MRSYPSPKVRGSDQERQAATAQEQRPRGATPPPRSGSAECRRAERSYSTFKVRSGGSEKIPLLQGKKQWLSSSGAAVKGYPKSEVRETQVRR